MILRHLISVSISGSLFVVFGAAPGSVRGADVAFVRDDVNADGRLSVSDALAIVQFTRGQGAAQRCLDAAGANDNGRVELVLPATHPAFPFLVRASFERCRGGLVVLGGGDP